MHQTFETPKVLPRLFLEDLSGQTEEQVRAHLIGALEIGAQDLDRFEILVAYESVGSWGCDSSQWLLLRDKNTGELFENFGSHCSCYGFEGQFKPEPTTVKYLRSDKFSISTGGYDESAGANIQAVRDYIRANL